MHIPDGYLSPSTCAVMYAAAGTGWYAALRRLRRTLNARMVPLIAVFAAFAFLVMMFNLPLPGGTTGHALGVTIAAIVLGPSGAVLALSIAVVVQAMFFGDGGITTLGANCFNIAVVGSLVSYGTYRLIASGASLTAKRRVVAAAVAGYLASNVSALVTAIEFGIQPILFHSADGTPLYAPYPLSVAVPVMMLGHLAVAGWAEALISAGLVAYLQVADPMMLRNTAGVVSDADAVATSGQKSLRGLWIVLTLLLLLTPLGVLAGGKAWGEWTASELASPANRAQIAAASHDHAPPQDAPGGLQRLSSVWTAPMPSYAPPFVKSAKFGYMLSAMFGVGCILGVSLFVRMIAERRAAPESLP